MRKHDPFTHDSGVAPVVAALLMVAIVLVLTMVLVMWVSTLGTMDTKYAWLGAKIEDHSRSGTHNWSIEVVSSEGMTVHIASLYIALEDEHGILRDSAKGFGCISNTSYILEYPNTDTKKCVVSGIHGNFSVTDMNGNGKLDRGDRIWLSETPDANSWEDQWRVKIYYSNRVIYDEELPMY